MEKKIKKEIKFESEGGEITQQKRGGRYKKEKTENLYDHSSRKYG